jgi:electron transport complex protein RnfB
MYEEVYHALEQRSIYRELAQRLDTIPTGFPSTDSGVELKILARLFTPEEAALAGVMGTAPETAADIAVRAGVDAALAGQLLEGMARKGLIRSQEEGGQTTFRLTPRMVPSPWTGLILRDAELGSLFEQYYQETRGVSLERPPAPRRVIPVQEAIPFDLQVHPYKQAVTLLENAKAWGVRDCICRLWQRSIGKACDHPLEVCMPFSSVERAFDDSEIDRALTKAEAIEILREAEEAGLVHTVSNLGDQPTAICNCCTCSCAILRGVAEFGIPTAVARSDFHSTIDAELCNGCGICTERCAFRAISLVDGSAVVDYARCVGCGLCTTACSLGALRLKPRPLGENPPVPPDYDSWLTRFTESRDMPRLDTRQD